MSLVDYLVRIQDLEAVSGIQFFPGLWGETDTLITRTRTRTRTHNNNNNDNNDNNDNDNHENYESNRGSEMQKSITLEYGKQRMDLLTQSIMSESIAMINNNSNTLNTTNQLMDTTNHKLSKRQRQKLNELSKGGKYWDIHEMTHLCQNGRCER